MKKHYILSTLLSIFTFFSINAQISFTADVTSGCAPLTVNFTNTTSDPNAVSYQWYFGTGNWFNGTNETQTFLSAGNYWAHLEAYDGNGGYLGNYEIEIQVSGSASHISMNNDSACVNDQTYFWLTIEATSSSWDFGDGTTYFENSGYSQASHNYSSPGTYVVSCEYVNQCGTFNIDSTVNIVSSGLGIQYLPYIYSYIDTTCPNSLVSFQTDDNYSNLEWDYNDGLFDYDAYSQHGFANLGWNYIDLTVTNGCGVSETVTDSVYIDNSAPVTGESVSGPGTICPGEQFYIQAWSDNGTTYEWDMADGSSTIMGDYINYTYSSIGTYSINLLITNDCGSTLNVPYEVVVSNNASINNAYLQFNTTTVCPGDPMEFWVNNQYDYYVDFGDGTGTSDGYNHVYNNLGAYPISVTYQNACGNSVTLYDTINVEDNLPFTGNPYANMNNGTVCVNTEAEFYAQSGYSSYVWDFGDGGTSTNKDADHIYTAAGTYNASVEITNGCGASTTVLVPVNIVDDMPVGNWYYQIYGDSACPNDEVLFVAENSGNGISYSWDFGDGTSSNGYNFAHSYTNPGLYIITIIATNGCGNDTTVLDSIVVDNNVYPGPNTVQVFNQPQGCIGDELYFVVAPSGAGDYTWDFGDGNSTTSTFPLVVEGEGSYDVALHPFLASGNYEAHFSVTNGCGNVYYDTMQVQIGAIGDSVQVNTGFFYNEAGASCQGQPIEFSAVGASSYSWNFGDGTGVLVTQGSLTPVYHTYANPGTYNIVVNGFNNCGNSDSRTEEIFIPQSLIDISTNAVQLANCGENNGMAVVSATGGMPPYEYSWSNGDNSVIADSLGSGLYVITVTDNNDCSSEGIVTVDDNQGPTILVDNVTNLGCFGGANGTISVSILGGAPPYEIIWSNGDQTEDIFGLVAGPYEIFVTDANGCMGMESITVTQPEEAIVSIITQPSACGNNTGGAMAVINSGAAPYNYIWPNQTGPVHQTGGLAPGIYELLVIDANTCLLQQDFVINENTAPIILLDSVATGTCSGDLSSIYINTIGGLPPFTYSWSNGTTDEDLTDVLPGDYDVQITSANGCSSYLTHTVEMTLPDENPICIVSVDTLLGGNLVVWEPIQTSGVDYYNVYKESSQSGLYYLIGTTDADSLSFYHDVSSDPQIRSWRYKIAAVDNCGNESDLSDEHKTIHLTANLGVGNVVNLIWDNYEGFNYSTFYVNRYHPTTGWMVIDSLGANLNSYTDVTPPSDSNLVYQVTISAPGLCSAQKAQDHNTTRSNRASINGGVAPTSDFSASAIQIVSGSSIDFTDESLNNPTTWSWDFYGATPATSTDQHPTNITYDNVGLYEVRLIVSNANGIDTLVRTNYIEVTSMGGAAPTSGFLASDTLIPEGNSVDFLDQSQNNPTSWTWLFDGASPTFSNDQSPTGIVYNTIGSYDVTLITSNANGIDTLIKTAYIDVAAANSINENRVDDIKIYPNPTSGQISIDVNGYNGPIDIQVFDLQGKLLLNKLNSTKNKILTLSMLEFETGMYLMKISSENEVKTIRLIKQ